MANRLMRRWVVGLLLASVAPRFAGAADLPAAPPANAAAAYAPAAPDWIVTIGAEARAIPAWYGAPTDKFSFTGAPLFSIRNKGAPPDFFGPLDSFGFPIINLGQVKIGPAFRINWERKAGDYTQLYGLGNVNWALQAGIFADYWPVPWLRLRGEVRQGIGGETGVSSDLYLDAVVPVGQWRFSAGPRLTLQTTAAISPYFSITPAQSAATVALVPVTGLAPLPPYHAGGGLYDYGVGAQVEYFFNDQWAAHAFTEYQRLTNSAADSPLVTQRGSPNQLTFGIGATYAFSMHPLW